MTDGYDNFLRMWELIDEGQLKELLDEFEPYDEYCAMAPWGDDE